MSDHRLDLNVGVHDEGVEAQVKRIGTAVHRTMEKIDRERANPQVDMDNAMFRKQAKYVQAEMDRLGAIRKDAQIELDVKGEAAAEAKLDILEQKAEHLERTYTMRVDVDRTAMSRVEGGLGKLGRMLGIARNQSTLFDGATSDWVKSITNAGVRLGPMTLRLSAIIPLLAVGAPLIMSLVGALGALTASVGSGLLGVLAGATAGLGAFSLGLTGIALIAVPLVKDIGKAHDAFAKLDKAVLTYGKNSDEAKKAMEKLDHVTGGLGKETAGAFRAMRNLNGEWKKATAGARPDFFRTVADGIKTARAELPLFARESVQSFHVASEGVQAWLKGIRGPEAQGIFHRLFNLFQTSLPNIMQGFGSFGTMLGRVADAARGMFQRFSEGFRDTLKGWADFAKPGPKINSVMATIEASASSLFKLLGASGHLIGAFFLAGAKSGNSLVSTITNLFNKWGDFLSTDAGRAKLHEFFMNAIKGAEKMVSVVGKMIGLFFQIAEATAPFANAILDVLNTVGKIAVVLGSIPGLIKTITLAWAASKVAGMAGLALGGGGAAAGAAGGAAAGAGARGALGGALAGILGKSGKLAGLAFKVSFVAAVAEALINAENLAQTSSEKQTQIWRKAGYDQAHIGRQGQAVRGGVGPAAPRGPAGPTSAPRIKPISGTMVQKLLVSADTSQVTKALFLVRQLQSLGKTRIAMRILSTAKGPEEAIATMQKVIKLTARGYKVTINAETGALEVKLTGAQAKAQRLARTFTARLNANDAASPKARKAMSNLLKTVRVFLAHLSAQDSASPAVQRLLGLLAGLHDRTIHLTTVTANVGSKNPPRAQRHAKGGKATSPGYVYGEEAPRHPEWIIATNPAYRSRNKALLAAAAKELGMEAFKGGGKFSRKHPAIGPHSKLQKLKDKIDYKETRYTQTERKLTSIQDLPLVDDDGQRIEGNIAKMGASIKTLVGLKKVLLGLYNELLALIDKLQKAFTKHLKGLRANEPSRTRGKGKKKEKNPLHDIWADRVEEYKSAKLGLEDDYRSYRTKPEDTKLDLMDLAKTSTGILGTKSDAEATIGGGAAGAGTGDTSNADAIAAQATEAARVANRALGLSEAALSVFRGPGDFGNFGIGAYQAAAGSLSAMQALGGGGGGNVSPAGFTGAAGGSPTINVYTLHPGDPQTLQAIAGAAVGGMGLQGAVSSPRADLGI
jgi:SLT domain-containing protein